MKLSLCFITGCICFATPVCAQPFSEGILNIKSVGATGKKAEDATIVIQHAIDSCYKKGGGIVFFPAGEYLSSTVELKDNVSLYLTAGAKLIASNNPANYKLKGAIENTGSEGTPVLIYANGAKNIGISGQGEIIGQPEYYTEEFKAYDFIEDDFRAAVKAGIKPWSYRWKKPNVSLVFLSKCENVLIENISLLNSPFWTLHAHWCRRVKIRGIYIYSELEKAVNADGIDIDGCQDVTISDCIITTADDAICLKTTRSDEGFKSCENVTVSNCLLVSTSCALKLGTESYGDFRHIIFNNCVIRNTNRGLGIFIRDGGNASNIVFSNITMECNRKPVGWWGSGDAFTFVVSKRRPDSKVGSINNLVVRNVIGHVQGTSVIEGYPGIKNTINNITLEDIQLFMYKEALPDKRATYALKINRVDEASLDHIAIKWDTKSPERAWLSPLSVSEINGFSINHFSGSLPPNNLVKKVIMEQNVSYKSK